MTAVQLTNLQKRFGALTVVDDLCLQLPEGSLSTLLGPSGCGKTTTLRMIAGLEQPTSGRIVVDGEPVWTETASIPAERRGIGMVFQSYAVWPHLTVFENVAYPLRVRRQGRKDIREKVMRALGVVRLDHLAERYPAQLSGGQQQRVALARAVVFEPRLLLLDEPLSNLDAQLREQMRVEIRQLQRRLGLTAIYVTHDQQEALAISDHVAVMDHGRVMQYGSPQDVFERPHSKRVAEFMGWTNFLPAERLDARHLRILPGGLVVDCPAGAPAGDLWAAVRPDDIRVRALAPRQPADVLVGRVADRSYLGNATICSLSIGEVLLRAALPPDCDHAPGTAVAVEIDPARLRVLSA